MADRLHPWPLAKRGLAMLPASVWPAPEPYGFVLELDETGSIVRSLQDPGGEVIHTITSVEPVGDTLYFGTLEADWIGRLTLDEG